MATNEIKGGELPPSDAAENALEILRVWVRRGADANTAVAANFRLETIHLDRAMSGA